MGRMKSKFQRFLWAVLLLNLRLSDSVETADEMVHINFHLPQNAAPFVPSQVIQHTQTQYENHIRRRNPSKLSPVAKQPPKYQSHNEKPKKADADSPREKLEDAKTQESMHSYKAIESMDPRIYYHEEPYDEEYNFRTYSDAYHSQFKDSDSLYYSPIKQLTIPIRTFEPDESDFEQEHPHYGHRTPPRDIEPDFPMHDSYTSMSDSRYPYNYKIRKNALKVIEPKLTRHYSKHYDSGYSQRPYRKSKNSFKPISYSHRHSNHKYSNEELSNNEPLTMDSLYDESYSYKPMKSHYQTMSDEYYNHEPMDMMSGYHRFPSRTPPKYVKFMASDSYVPRSRYRTATHHSSYKDSEPYMTMDSYRAKHTRDPGLQGYEYLSSYPWL